MKKQVLILLAGLFLTFCSTDEVLLTDKNCYISDIKSEVVDEKYLVISSVVRKCSNDSNPLSQWVLDYGAILYEGGREYIILGASVVGNEELVRLRLVLDLTQEPVVIKDEYMISLRYGGQVLGSGVFTTGK